MSEGRGRFGLPRARRIRSSRDYRRISRRGVRISSDRFVLLVAAPRESGVSVHRLGITASRRVGNAVARNRVKRRIREWFRHRAAHATRPGEAPLDWVVIARRPAASLSTEAVGEALDGLAARAVSRVGVAG